MATRYDILTNQKPEQDLDYFEEGDRVEIQGLSHYGQDHSFWEGSFPDVVFTVKGRTGECLNLIAPGYGDREKYGNGAIFVGKSCLTCLRKAKGETLNERSTDSETAGQGCQGV